MPCSGSTHRVSSDVDLTLVNLEFLPKRFDNFQHGSCSLPEARHEAPLTGRRYCVVAKPSTVSLWDDNVTGIFSLHLGQGPEENPKQIAAFDLFLIVAPRSP
jgi:hypothetical protein